MNPMRSSNGPTGLHVLVSALQLTQNEDAKSEEAAAKPRRPPEAVHCEVSGFKMYQHLKFHFKDPLFHCVLHASLLI